MIPAAAVLPPSADVLADLLAPLAAVPEAGQLRAAAASLELAAAREPGLGLDGRNRTADGHRAVARFLLGFVTPAPASRGRA